MVSGTLVAHSENYYTATVSRAKATPIILAIDPGGFAKGCAVARFSNDTRGLVGIAWHVALVGIAWHVALDDLRRWPGVTRIVAEQPQLDARSKRAASGVLNLAWYGALVVGALWGGDPDVALELVTPTTWKGSVPKPVHHRRAWGTLTPLERVCLGGDATERMIGDAVDRGAKDRWSKDGVRYYRAVKGAVPHDALDAVALGLWAVGRLPK